MQISMPPVSPTKPGQNRADSTIDTLRPGATNTNGVAL
jgi:hypothetical protein